MNGQPHPAQQALDIPLKATLGRLTHGVSPASLAQAYQDWWTHLAVSPGKQLELARSANLKAMLWWRYVQAAMAGDPNADEALDKDKRFTPEQWRKPPFDAVAQAFLLAQQWWSEATAGVRGVSLHHEQVVGFMTRQWLDMASPSNWPWLNPEVIEETSRTGGMNLWQGFANWSREAMLVATNGAPPGAERFRPGEAVALTPGKVVMRNRLVELIQYSPTTAKVHPEPVLVVPSWIMKYYILDLSPHNSMVRWLVDQGHTVFMVSWRNPGAEDRDLGMDDYLELGVLEPLQAVRKAQPGRLVHLAGYCLGGTLAAIAAATLASRNEAPLKTLTLLAAQTDFEQPGELGLFIDESQVSFLEDIMAEQGFLDGRQMAGAFALINSKDLVWSKLVHEYLMGAQTPLDDLHAWNADATRMPARMHSEYLRKLYLNNDLGAGRYTVRGKPVVLEDIRVPMFVVGTERDHVSPWRSVFKVHLLAPTEITFALTTGGHNVGIVNPPLAQPDARISHRVGTSAAGSPYRDADAWLQAAGQKPGSWWPTWHSWLAQHSGAKTAPWPLGGKGPGHLPLLGEAPGQYVHES